MSARNEKLFNGPNQTRFRRTQSLCLILRKVRLDTKNLLLIKVLLLKVCELQENTFPYLGEGDTNFHDTLIVQGSHVQKGHGLSTIGRIQFTAYSLNSFRDILSHHCLIIKVFPLVITSWIAIHQVCPRSCLVQWQNWIRDKIAHVCLFINIKGVL